MSDGVMTRRRSSQAAPAQPGLKMVAAMPCKSAATTEGSCTAAHRPSSLLRDELPAVVLLVVLYMLQGVPLGLSMGSM
jgi:hypothetical protein